MKQKPKVTKSKVAPKTVNKNKKEPAKSKKSNYFKKLSKKA